MIVIISGWFAASVYAALVPWMAIAFRWELQLTHAVIGLAGLVSMFVCLATAAWFDERARP